MEPGDPISTSSCLCLYLSCNPANAPMEGIGEKNRASPLDKNDKDAVAVYEVVRGLPKDEDCSSCKFLPTVHWEGCMTDRDIDKRKWR